MKKNGFIEQAAMDYAMTYEQVDRIHNLHPEKFHEKLEEHIKERANLEKGPAKATTTN